MKIKLSELKAIIREELILQEKRKSSTRSASKTDGPPPYREQGSTESQAQQMAAGIAYSARMKRGKARKAAERKIKSYGGAAWALYSGEITNKELKNLAKLGQKVKGHKAKEPKHRKSLPGHVTPSKRRNENVNERTESDPNPQRLKATPKKAKKESVVINEDLSAIPRPSEWYQNTIDYWGSKDSPGVNAVHDTLSSAENVPFASIPAGIMNAFIYHAKGQNQKALLSLGFAALGGGAAKYLTKAIKNPGSAQKFFAKLGHAGRKLAGKIKGHDFTILLTNPDAAQKAIATAALITPAAGEAAEDQINKLLDMSKEVHMELQRSQKFHDEFKKTIPRFTMRTVPTHVPIPGGDGVRDYDKQMSVPIGENGDVHGIEKQ